MDYRRCRPCKQRLGSRRIRKRSRIYVHWKDYRNTRLLPIFEQLSLEKKGKHDHPEGFAWCYPLKPVSPDAIYPDLRTKLQPKAPIAAQKEYVELFDGIVRNLRVLKHKNSDVSLWLEHFESLMMIHTSAVPAARAGHVVPDVSLYDHSRMTSALAVALYLYHRDSGTLTVHEIKDYAKKKFVMVSERFMGIQKFIFSRFGESSRYRSKILRGRSFAVSLMAELAADLICREIGLPSVSTILNAAGKFTILAPNTEKASSALKAATSEINHWLFNASYGETVINVSTVQARCDDFVSGKFTSLWEHINRAMAEKKFESLDLETQGGVVSDYLDRFVSDPEHAPLCALCGKRPRLPTSRGVYTCPMYVRRVHTAGTMFFLAPTSSGKQALCPE